MMCCCRIGARLAMVNPAKLCRAVSLMIGCVGMMVAGSIYSFNAYTVAVKNRFNLTQPQVEMVAAIQNLGFCFGLPAGLFQERFGPTWTFLVATVMGTIAYVLLWSSTVLVKIFNQYYGLLHMCFFLQGFASMFLYMGCLPANMANFSASNRGKVVSVLDAFFGAGPAIFGAIYTTCFKEGHIDPNFPDIEPESEDIKNFYLMMSLVFSIVGVLGMAFVRQIPWEEDELADTGNEESSLVVDDHISRCRESHSFVSLAEVNVTGIKLLKSLNFHLLFWSFVIFSSIQLVLYNNTAVYLQSFGQMKYFLMLTIMGPTVAALVKPVYGWLSDALIKRVPRVLYLLVFNSLTTVLLVMCTFLADKIGVFSTTSLVAWLASGALWGMTPTILSELFGMRFFARNWGSMHLGFALFSWLLHLFYGYLYQTAIGRYGGSVCYGQHCFTWSFFILALLGCCATTMNAVLLIRQLGMRRRARVPPPPPPPKPHPIRYETRID